VKTIRRLLYLEVIQAVAFVSLGFLALFFFFDLVDELPNLGRGIEPYRMTRVLMVVALRLPAHLYELLPIAVLIGTIFVMARLAQSSEYTILAPAAWARGVPCARSWCSGWASRSSPSRSATTWLRSPTARRSC